MSTSIVQSASAIGTTASTAVTLGAAPTVGNTLVAIMGADAYQTAAPTAGSTRSYTSRLSSQNNLGFYIWTRLVTAGDSATTTFTLGAASSACVVIEVAGTYDKVGTVTTTNNSAGTTQVTTGLSPTTTDGLTLSVAGITSTAVALSGTSADNGFTLAIGAINPSSGAGQANALVFQKVTSSTGATGTTTLSWTGNASDRAGAQVAFTALAGGGGGITGSAAQTLPALTQAATGTRTVPTFTGASAQTLPPIGQSATGSAGVPGVIGTAAQTLPPLVQASAGTSTPPTFSGSAGNVLPAIGQAAAGTRSLPVFTAAAAQTLPAITQAVTATHTTPTFSATATQTLPALSQAATGTATTPPGGTTSTLPALTQAAAGSASPPVFGGVAGSVLPPLVQAGVGSSAAPTFSGTMAQVLPALGQVVQATTQAPVVITGTIAQALPALTQEAYDNTRLPGTLPPITQFATNIPPEFEEEPLMYCTVKDVKNALSPAATEQGTANLLSDAQLTDAINEADSIIRAYIGMKYKIPTALTPVEPATIPATFWSVAVEPIRYWSRDIAAYLATLTYKRNQDVPQDDPVRLRLNLALQQLVMIRDGKSELPFPPADLPEGWEPGVFVFNQYEGDLFSPADFGLVPVAATDQFGIWPGGPV